MDQHAATSRIEGVKSAAALLRDQLHEAILLPEFGIRHRARSPVVTPHSTSPYYYRVFSWGRPELNRSPEPRQVES